MWTNMIKSSLKFEGLFQQVQYEMNLCKETRNQISNQNFWTNNTAQKMEVFY